MARTLVALALLSGGAALIYEAVWLRWFRLLFGNTAYAASATLSAFFAGMALAREVLVEKGVDGLVPDGRDAGRRVGVLYASNTLGAALGSAAGSLWLPDAVGVRATYGVAMALSLGVAGVALTTSPAATIWAGRTDSAIGRDSVVS